MDGDTQVCVSDAQVHDSDSTFAKCQSSNVLDGRGVASGDDQIPNITKSHWLNADANVWVSVDDANCLNGVNESYTPLDLFDDDNEDCLDESQEIIPNPTRSRGYPQCHSAHCVFQNGGQTDSVSTPTSSGSRGLYGSLSTSCLLQVSNEQHSTADGTESGRVTPLGYENVKDGIGEGLESNCENVPVPRFKPTINQHVDEEDPDPELPRMSTILEKLPWNSIRAREYLIHYLQVAEQKGDHYKMQKLKQQLKYLNIRHKKRSYSEDNNQWNVHGSPNTKKTTNSETWWRNGMKTNHPNNPSIARHAPTPNLETRHTNDVWNPHCHPVSPPRVPPVLRNSGPHLQMAIPFQPAPWPTPYWEAPYTDNWSRQQFAPAWPVMPCPPCPPPWGGYRRPPLPPSLPLAGGDIFRMKQDTRWSRRMGRF